MQMIQQNGQPAQVVQIQRTSDDRCEIIVQPTEIQDTTTTTHYYTEDGMKICDLVHIEIGAATENEILHCSCFNLQMKYFR